MDCVASRRARAALRFWDDFPVDADPRPIVLTASPITGPDGFTSDEAKLAFEEGAIAPGSGVTPEVLKALGARDLSGHRGHSLRVLGVSRRTAPFRTDRGLRRLPAWEVSLSQTHGAVMVIDPQVQATAWFPAAANLDLATGFGQWGRLAEDSRSLTFGFMGSPSEYTDYPRAEVLETDAVVVVCPVAVEKPGAAARRGYAQAREVSVTLREPLGARVLVSLAGLPVMIEMSATD